MSRAQLIWRIKALWSPAVTLGVRCLVVDPSERILLLRHTYVSGWHFPGGGVDPHESAREAAARELVEETGLPLQNPPDFFGLYFNRALAGRDHVALYVATFETPIARAALRPARGEIAEVGLFSRSDLPEGTAPSVRRRLGEVFDGAPRPDEW